MPRSAEPYVVSRRNDSKTFQITVNPSSGLPRSICRLWRRRSFQTFPAELAQYRAPKDKPAAKAGAFALITFLKKKQDETSAQGAAVPDIPVKTLCCDYLFQFWDFGTSDYFRELETMGKEPHQEHASEMQKSIDRYYRPYFGSLPLQEITEEQLQKFVVYLKIDKSLSASTVHSARNAAFVALRYAKRKKVIKDFDFDAVLRAGGKAKTRGILEKEEIEKLLALEWDNKKSRMAVLIAYRTGIRMGEVRALRICDIHETYINIEHSWAKKSKMKGTKNEETRVIPILPSLYAEITAYIRQELSGKNRYKLDGLLLPGRTSDKPYDNRRIGQNFNKMLGKIGIDDVARKERNIVFHSWRHLLAKNLAESGTNKKIAMKILGHKSSTVYDNYASHADKETFEKMTQAVINVSEETKKVVNFKVS
jgi:integrase